ncbi:hypothetical protein ADICYQ_1251 [Cyclobacterium qasimii M12-11B]|nr:hypothetical protein [Cyclobacterium qasimii]EPR69810.1 hypothetical protein ADICYQ_1251 [Cyclobacterium qasimii M12-11B]
MGEKLKDKNSEESKAAFRQFSQALDKATQAAAQSAFWTIYSKAEAFNSDNNHTVRPIICGGDDISIIIRADLALEFTEIFLNEFEVKTKEEFKVLEKYDIDEFKEGITACAGIAYIKESYPLHYALNLSETLCKDAKKLVKEHHLRQNGIPESAIAFYKVQESFTDKISVLKERTLLATQQGKTLDYYYGPYLLSDMKNLQKRLSDLRKEADDSQEGSKAIGKIRRVISDSFKDFSVALFNLQRMKTINKDFFSKLQLQNDLDTLTLLTKEDLEQIAAKSQLLDLITLHGFRYGTRHN